MSALYIFLACFAVVFLLGIQQLNVNGRHYLAAMLTSYGIGTAQLFLLKVMPQPTSHWEIAAYLNAGPIAIACAMAAHPWLLKLFAKRRAGL